MPVLASSAVSPDALLGFSGLLVTVLVAGATAMWHLASKLARMEHKTDSISTLTSKELQHNGGGSMKDYARDARDAAARAELVAEEARQRAAALGSTIDRIDGRLAQSEVRNTGFEAATTQRLGDLDHHARNTRMVLDFHVKQAAANEIAWREYETAKGGTPPPPTLSARADV